MKKVAISACLLGKACRYDGTSNYNEALLKKLSDVELVPCCPEDFSFGTPRPTMDLVMTEKGLRAISNESGDDLSDPILAYAQAFFEVHKEVGFFVGKDRSPSCGVQSVKYYDVKHTLLSTKGRGLMAQEAQKRGVACIDAETLLEDEL